MLNNRFIYTHSECSSSLSSITSISSDSDVGWNSAILHTTSLVMVATNAGLASIFAIFPHYHLSYLQILAVGGTQWSMFLVSRHINPTRYTQFLGTLLASLSLFVLSLNQSFWMLLLVQGILMGLGLGLCTLRIDLPLKPTVMSAGVGGIVLSVLVTWLLQANSSLGIFIWLAVMVFLVNTVGFLIMYWADPPVPMADSSITLINYLPAAPINYWYKISMLLYSLVLLLPPLIASRPYGVILICLGSVVGCLAPINTLWLLSVALWFLWVPWPYIYVVYGLYGIGLGGGRWKVNEAGVVVGCVVVGALLDYYQEVKTLMLVGSIGSLAFVVYLVSQQK